MLSRVHHRTVFEMKKGGLLLKLILVLVSAALLGGCFISSFHPPIEKLRFEGVSRQDGVLQFAFQPAEVTADKNAKESPMAALPLEAVLLQQYLEKHSKFSSVVLSPTPPASGTYVVLTKTVEKYSGVKDLSCIFGVFTLFVLPCYHDKDSTSLRYDLSIDGRFIKTYKYQIKEKALIWWGAIPFFWVSSLMTSYNESCEAITAQFLLDAHSDGFI
jgi:hypothetical protein